MDDPTSNRSGLRLRILRAFLISLTLMLMVLVGVFVELAPAVDENFFFAGDDPAFQMDAKIAETFESDPQVIVSATGNLNAVAYFAKVGRLTRALADVKGVKSVQSVTRGPRSVSAAFSGPFWRRLVVGEDGRSTLLVVLLARDMSSGGDARARVIEDLERVMEEHQGRSFELALSGVPYVVELIRRNLKEDMTAFSSAAVVVFGIIVLVTFRSMTMMIGTMSSCFFACSVTLLILHAFQIPIGILTANLLTIVFIMTLQHTVYLGFNIRNVSATTRREAVRATVAMTRSASWWGMVTTMAGFASLLLVQARPLRELGISGGIGAVVSFVSAYLIFPHFLHLVTHSRNSDQRQSSWFVMTRFFAMPHVLPLLLILAAAIALVPAARRLDADPSLLAYFSETSALHRGLVHIDRNGGSSPLLLTVRDAGGMRFDSEPAYDKLWSLQNTLEKHPSVGTVLSAAPLMSEAKKTPFAFIFNYRYLLEKMEGAKYGRITNAFLTQDRRTALFFLRMKENVRRDHRLTEIEQLKAIVVRQGFKVEQAGGLYFLQGRLSRLIRESLFTGFAQLVGCFILVAAAVARSLRWILAMVVTLCIPATLVFGGIGLLNMPVDIVSAPAVNIAVAMGIADMLQLTTMARRLRLKGRFPGEAWSESLNVLWKPAAVTSVAVSCGFAIFLLSNFPPTQRFGVAVVAGTIFALFGSLIALPALAAAGRKGWSARRRAPGGDTDRNAAHRWPHLWAGPH